MTQTTEKQISIRPTLSRQRHLWQWLSIAVLVYLLITAVGVIGAGFKLATAAQAKELFTFATNPFLGLLVGIIATALVQSSSTVTSITVGLVAGGLPVLTAIPIVMGANMGTSITNTLVSLGHVGDSQAFRRAFAAATVHDFFNLLNVLIFLPIELIFHPLEKISYLLAQNLVGDSSLSVKDLNFITPATQPIIQFFQAMTASLVAPLDGIVLIGLGVALMFGVITLIGKLLKRLMVGRARDIVHTAIGNGPIAGIAAGTLITVLVQSSSTTTSLMVPLAGAGVFGLAEIYPFTLGANIGTCITALLAATAIAGVEAVPALEIALVHLFFNLFGVILIYGIPFLCRIPVVMAERLAIVASQRVAIAMAYIIGMFFVVPGVLLGLTSLF